ncbi:MAG: hypothetical protein GTN89_11515, partial [Acidobacteria bacterium]|nr:hypothetical protein [Acidobacteriota bacterium]
MTAATQLRRQRLALRRLNAGAVDLLGMDHPGPEKALDLIREAVASFVLAGDVHCVARVDRRLITTPDRTQVDRLSSIASGVSAPCVVEDGDHRFVVAPFEAVPG